MTVQALLPLKKLEERLGDIQVANGYHTDAGLRVFLGRSFIEDSEVPAVTVRPAEEEGEVEVNAGLYQETIAYEINGVCDADLNKPFEAGYRLAADIRRAIYRARSIDFEDLDGTAVRVTPGGTVVTEREPGSRLCEVTVALSITHSERLGEPDLPE